MANGSSIGLSSLDSLFGDEVQENITKTDIDVSKLKSFTNHPFSLYAHDELQKLSDSIKTHGLFTPILVRPIEDKKYTHEIIAGHNRVAASKLAGLKKITCDVRDLDDSLATIIMVDTNLNQRQYIKPSEKAKAYQMRLDAIKSQGKRTDLTSVQVGQKLNQQFSRNVLGDENNVSGGTIRRFIRLNNLSPELLKKVDDKKLAFTSAVELSYLSVEQQADLYEVLDSEEKYGVPLKVATTLKGIATNGTLSRDKIKRVITTTIKDKPKDYRVSHSAISKYFDNDVTPKEVNDTIDKALELWRKKNPLSLNNISREQNR